LWGCLEKEDVPIAYISVTEDRYEGMRVNVRTLAGDIIDLRIEIRVHGRSTLCDFPFTIIMYVLLKGIQEEAV